MWKFHGNGTLISSYSGLCAKMKKVKGNKEGFLTSNDRNLMFSNVLCDLFTATLFVQLMLVQQELAPGSHLEDRV